MSGVNNIVYHNVSPNNANYTGTVNFTYSCSTPLLNGAGNIDSDPMFVDLVNCDFHLQPGSPCIDTGDPNSPLDPDSTRADMGALFFNHAGGLSLSLTPHNYPIQIPGSGGTITYDAELQNTTVNPVTIDVWTMVILPNGTPYGPLLLRENLVLPAGANIMRTLNQNVPAAAPPGNYTYIANAGDYPNVVECSDDFFFAKLLNDGGAGAYSGWAVSGWEDSPDPVSNVVPAESVLLTAYPNPFNNRSTISFNLQESGMVRLIVYDINGNTIAAMIDGWRNAGLHYLGFSADNLASGIYFCALTGEGFSETRKVVLVK